MHNISFFFVGLLAWLVAGVVATIPHTLYRGDTRNPATIKAAGGFKSKGATHKLGPDGTVIQHVEGTLKYPSRDPYISTSSDIAEARKKAGSKGYVYTIDTTGITSTFVDVAAEYVKINKKYGHADEKEFAAYLTIPWANIVSAQEAKSGKAVPLSKRADWWVGEDEDVDDSVPDWDNVYDREDGNVNVSDSDSADDEVNSRDNVVQSGQSGQSDVGQVVQVETLAAVRRVAKPLRV
ncbi:hypothetical protein Sste5346_009987 [Sporothrix stenoceras]|uniref:Uncharacterized protein n=1 Tax=Sporothrix stenoceras TaxID=5173 RepID=A0ABR3YIY5_9PEZI